MRNPTQFITYCSNLHNNKYTYSDNDFSVLHIRSYITIFCTSCQLYFNQRADHHKNGVGCPHCKNIRISKIKSKDLNHYITKAKEIHGDIYDYSLCEYTKGHTKTTIICRKHGEFLQSLTSHIRGIGCPHCKTSKAENKIVDILTALNIVFERQQTFSGLIGKKLPLRYDFYLKELNILIEYNGEQHYKPIKNWGETDYFKSIVENDAKKVKYANDNNIPLLVIPYITVDLESCIKNFLN